jgi:hypothetical protein
MDLDVAALPDFLSGLLEPFESGQAPSRSFSLPSVDPEPALR